MVEDAAKTLIKCVTYAAHVENKHEFLEYRPDARQQPTNRDFQQRLRDKFSFDKQQILDEELIDIVLYEFFSP